MDLQKFLSLFACLMGFIGAIFLAKGVLALSPKAMLELTPPHARIGYAPEHIVSLATQKADTLIGVIYIGSAFVIQIISLLSSSRGKLITETRWMGFWIVLAIISLITIIFSLSNVKIRHWYRIKMGKLEVERHCNYHYSKNDFSERFVRETETMSRELLDLQRKDTESNSDFMRRVSQLVECPILDQVDFSKYDSEQGKTK